MPKGIIHNATIAGLTNITGTDGTTKYCHLRVQGNGGHALMGHLQGGAPGSAFIKHHPSKGDWSKVDASWKSATGGVLHVFAGDDPASFEVAPSGDTWGALQSSKGALDILAPGHVKRWVRGKHIPSGLPCVAIEWDDGGGFWGKLSGGAKKSWPDSNYSMDDPETAGGLVGEVRG